MSPIFQNKTNAGLKCQSRKIFQNIENAFHFSLKHSFFWCRYHTNTPRRKLGTQLLREAGIAVPVVPGIMPITAANQVKRSIELSGSFMPQRYKTLVDRFGNNANAMKQAGIAYATDQIIDLYANGIKAIHVYSMNKPEVAEKILNNVSDILGR